MGIRERERLIENIARLKRAEEEAPNAEIAAVREDLEVQLGGTVSRGMSARLLGVSHTALNNWVAAGDIPVVITKAGRKEIPLRALLDLRQQVERQRRSGRRRLHLLEPVMAEGRRRADGMRLPTAGEGDVDPHRKAELRALAYHRAVAPRLRRKTVEEAERKLERWKQEGKIHARYAEAWEEVFALPMPKIRKAISADNSFGRDLRQNSPLAGLLSEPERRRILEKV